MNKIFCGAVIDGVEAEVTVRPRELFKCSVYLPGISTEIRVSPGTETDHGIADRLMMWKFFKQAFKINGVCRGCSQAVGRAEDQEMPCFRKMGEAVHFR
ncbi:hypothetical protein FQZ97_1152180 [compost metagenome]